MNSERNRFFVICHILSISQNKSFCKTVLTPACPAKALIFILFQHIQNILDIARCL